MENKIIDSPEDSLSLIRNKVKEDVIKSDFRRKLIGGISEEDVEDYINMMQLQFQYRENKLKEEIDELINLKDKLRVEFNTHIEKTDEEKKKLLKDLEEAKHSLEDYINQYTEKDKQISELESYKEMFEQEKTSKIALNEELEQLRQKLKHTEQLLGESQYKIQELQNYQLQAHNAEIYRASEELKGKNYNDEINSLYKELERVKDQVKVNGNLQRQLEQERQRTEKVEREMAAFFERVLELKDNMGKSNGN